MLEAGSCAFSPRSANAETGHCRSIGSTSGTDALPEFAQRCQACCLLIRSGLAHKLLQIPPWPASRKCKRLHINALLGSQSPPRVGAASREAHAARLLQGTGKSMRHVKLRPGTATNAAALRRLIDAAYSDIKARVEHGYFPETPWELCSAGLRAFCEVCGPSSCVLTLSFRVNPERLRRGALGYPEVTLRNEGLRPSRAARNRSVLSFRTRSPRLRIAANRKKSANGVRNLLLRVMARTPADTPSVRDGVVDLL